MLPVAEDAETLELHVHHVDEAGGVGAARAPEIGQRHVAFLRAELAVDLQLNRQSVTVVAEHVRGIEPHHGPRLHHEVLQDLVHGRAEVNPAVRVRRTVVQHELRPARAALADALVQTHLGPARERLRLCRLEVRLHREVGARQVQRVLPLSHGSFYFSAFVHDRMDPACRT
jgi:hypothetical protein